MFRIAEVNTFDAAQLAFQEFRNGKRSIHCAVCDVELDRNTSLIDLMSKSSMNPYVVAFSGIQCHRTLSTILDLGVVSFVQKGGNPFMDIVGDVQFWGVISLMHNGRMITRPSMYEALKHPWVLTPKEWAEAVHVSVSQLERICILNESGSPERVLSQFKELTAMVMAADGRYCLSGAA